VRTLSQDVILSPSLVILIPPWREKDLSIPTQGKLREGSRHFLPGKQEITTWRCRERQITPHPVRLACFPCWKPGWQLHSGAAKRMLAVGRESLMEIAVTALFMLKKF
jgi:hypothetical protein